MKVVDCHWEMSNIGKKTVEICVDISDVYDKYLLEHCIRGYDYAVVKVAMNMPTFNIGLAGQGFVCIENQMNVGIARDDFDFSKVGYLYNDTSFDVVDTKREFQSVMSLIQPGMFSTDRIAIDPHFGETIGCLRYKNWLASEYSTGKSLLVKINFRKENVGFMLVRIDEDTIDLLLNGLYKPFQGKGIGILTPASPMMFAKQHHLSIKKELTSISSNNIPVVKLYNRLHFQILNQSYVFVKHIIQ